MAQSRHEKNVQPSMLARTEDIQQQIQELSGRDLQLWSIGILIMLVLTAGLLALVLPNLVWAQRVIRVEQAYLPQLFFGLISLVLLFNIYLLTQKRTLNSTRHALIRELVLNERLESLSLIDPLTQLLNRRAVNELMQREVEQWNLNSKKDFEMAFTWAQASYVTGTDADEVLRAVDRKLHQKKNKLVPVF